MSIFQDLAKMELDETTKAEYADIREHLDLAFDEMESLVKILAFAESFGLPCWESQMEIFTLNTEGEYEDHGEVFAQDCMDDWIDHVSGDFRDVFPNIRDEVLIAAAKLNII